MSLADVLFALGILIPLTAGVIEAVRGTKPPRKKYLVNMGLFGVLLIGISLILRNS